MVNIETDEMARLAKVRGLELQTVSNPEAFNVITSLVATTLGCSTSLITILDEDIQWFLGRTGFARPATPRSMSICSFCVASQSPLLIGDTALDSRFSNNPLVTGPSAIRSYLGVPLLTDENLSIGVLCAISSTPDAFSLADVKVLQSFAALVKEAIASHVHVLTLRHANMRLAEQNKCFEEAEEIAGMGSWRIDFYEKTIHWSNQAYAIYGMSDKTSVNLSDAISFLLPEDRPAVRKALNEARRHGMSFQVEANILRLDGRLRRIRLSGKRLDHAGKPHAIAGIVVDCTEEHSKSLALHDAAERDQLTKLLNRAAFDKCLHETFAVIDGSLLTAALLNIDAFKDLNETLGHHAGDQLLALLGQRLKERCDHEVIVARWGGDEFALLFPRDTLLEEAASSCMQLMTLLAKEASLMDEEVSVSVTCGIAQIDKLSTPEDLVRRADLALCFGKENGRGSVHCWSERLEGASTTRQRAINVLKAAFSEGRTFAAYQPIVELETGRVVGVEALLRLEDGVGGILTASDVFSALTEPAMSRRISRFMIQQVLNDGQRILERFGEDCRIGLNVSEADLRLMHSSEDFVGLITRLMLKCPLRPQNITIEITETMLLCDEDGYIRDGLRALHRLGFSIALDDFGTGYSSLTHLRDFPIQKVKIDREFVSAISSNHHSRMIIQAIVQMSRSLGIDVVAEGVENANEEVFLRAVGCRYGQGFRYGRPLAISSIEIGTETLPAVAAPKIASLR
jgi:diguanylate cyclase (GGDEF)-like protein/PAS domain S-box-containing protein